MPLPLSRLQIDTDEALGKQIVSRPMSAEVIRGWRFDRQIDQAEFFIYGDLRPDACVAVSGPGAVFPRLVSKLTRSRDGIEPPKLFAGAHVEGAHEPFGVVMSLDGCAFPHRRAHEHDILDNDR